MSSKEALKYIFDILMNLERFYDVHDEQNIEKQKFDIVKKDLDRLEELEKENQELKEKCKMLEENEEAVLTTLEISVKENARLKEVIEARKNPSKLDCTHMFDNCKLTSLPELEALENDK